MVSGKQEKILILEKKLNFMSENEISRHLYLSQKALLGETSDEEDKELEALEKE